MIGDTWHPSRAGVTGSTQPPDVRLVKYPFGRFEVTVILSQSNEFVGIKEIVLHKDFLSPEQRLANAHVHDVDKFYKE